MRRARRRSRLLPGVLLGVMGAGLWASHVRAEQLPPPPEPNEAFYGEHIAPWFEENCAACHRDGGGGFRMAARGADVSASDRRRHDFQQARAFVRPDVPWESPLYLKLLEPGEGGEDHAGGAFFRSDDEAHDTLLDFVSGATLDNLPPEVYFEKPEIRGQPGKAIAVDGRDSYDRDRDDMERLTFHWTLFAKPAGSRVTLSDRRASRVEITPDAGGSYVLKLRVGDGKVWSAPRAVTVEVFDHVEIEARAPGGISGLEEATPRDLQRVRRLFLDVLGRPPTPAEALTLEKRGAKDLVRTILLRAESGRAWYEELTIRYGLYDQFRPTGAAARALALRIPSENLAPPEVEATLLRDPAFLARHPPGRSLATALFALGLGREPTDAETDAALQLAGGQPASVPGLGEVADAAALVEAVVTSSSFRRAAVERRLRRFLPTGETRRRLEEAVAVAQEGGAAWRAFLEGVLRDARYLDRRALRPKGPVTFLRSLFIDLLERKPTDRELIALVRATQRMPGTTAPYAAIVKILVDSGQAPIPLLVDIKDAPRWINDRFLRYLGRRPSKAELDAYGQALLHPAGGPELVIHGLLSGPEYACR